MTKLPNKTGKIFYPLAFFFTPQNKDSVHCATYFTILNIKYLAIHNYHYTKIQYLIKEN